MKILILKNKGADDGHVEWVQEYLQEYYGKKFPKKGWIEPMTFDFDTKEIDLDVQHKLYGTTSRGLKAYGSSNAKEYIRTIVPRNTYHCVIHLYENKFKPKDGQVAAFVTFSGVFDETEYMEIPTIYLFKSKLTIVHEFMHVIGNILEKLGLVKKEDDQMDATMVDGKLIPYHKNNYPTTNGGNYDVTFRAFAPHMHALDGLLKKKTIVETIKEVFTPTDNFNEVIDHVLKWEGGYVNDPKDPGGETKYGISKRAYPKEDIKNLAKERAIEIYKKDYWLASHCDKMELPVAIMVFDTAVNMGVVRAKKILQTALGVKVDGIVGKQTLGALEKSNKTDLLMGYVKERMKLYISFSTFSRFGLGWTNRTLDTLHFSIGKL